MPYTHRKVGNKQCIYKKDGGAKVGCTKGDVHKYLAALHANANESTLPTTAVCPAELMGVKMNEMKGGKAEGMSIKDIANKNDVSVDKIKSQINKGKKVEHEHTNSDKIAKDIAKDHLSEFPDYYDRLEKMEKKAANKWEVNESTKSLIKRLLREGLESSFTEEYFKKRIPFLKDFNFFKHHRYKSRVEAQRFSFHENVKKVFKGDIYTFPQFNVSSEFIFDKQKIDDNIFYNFSLKNDFHMMQPKNVDDLTFKILLMATKQISKQLSYQKEIMVKEGQEINPAELDKIINDLNGKLFEFERISAENNTALF